MDKSARMTTLLHVALPLEARPWLAALQLKRVENLGRWTVYAREGWHLIVSGVGPARAAAAVGAACARFAPQRLLSFGIAGAPRPLADKGELRLIHAIHEQTTGRAFYPDILEKHPFREAALTTWPRRVTSADAPTTLVEMEAAGVWQAASAFLPPHRISLVKVVSDHLEDGDLDVTQVEAWLEAAVDQFLPWWEQAGKHAATLPPLPENFAPVVEGLAHSLKLTATQSHQLRREAEDAFHRCGRMPTPLIYFSAPEVTQPHQRDHLFTQLREQLLAE